MSVKWPLTATTCASTPLVPLNASTTVPTDLSLITRCTTAKVCCHSHISTAVIRVPSFNCAEKIQCVFCDRFRFGGDHLTQQCHTISKVQLPECTSFCLLLMLHRDWWMRQRILRLWAGLSQHDWQLQVYLYRSVWLDGRWPILSRWAIRFQMSIVCVSRSLPAATHKKHLHIHKPNHSANRPFCLFCRWLCKKWVKTAGVLFWFLFFVVFYNVDFVCLKRHVLLCFLQGISFGGE